MIDDQMRLAELILMSIGALGFLVTSIAICIVAFIERRAGEARRRSLKEQLENLYE
jgi:hypothetical protein